MTTGSVKRRLYAPLIDSVASSVHVIHHLHGFLSQHDRPPCKTQKFLIRGFTNPLFLWGGTRILGYVGNAFTQPCQSTRRDSTELIVMMPAILHPSPPWRTTGMPILSSWFKNWVASLFLNARRQQGVRPISHIAWRQLPCPPPRKGAKRLRLSDSVASSVHFTQYLHGNLWR